MARRAEEATWRPWHLGQRLYLIGDDAGDDTCINFQHWPPEHLPVLMEFLGFAWVPHCTA